MRISDWSSDVCSSDLTKATPEVIEQIIHQLDRLIPVHSVNDLSAKGPHVEREMALVKVAGTSDHRIEALRLAEVYRARVVDATISSFIFEVTGTTAKIDTFVGLRSEEHKSELPSLMHISYSVFCMNKQKILKQTCIKS